MAKNQTDWAHIIVVIILIVVVVWAVKYKSADTYTVVNTETIKILEQQPNPECTLSFDRVTVYPGQSVTGTVVDGANTQCNWYYKHDGVGWYFGGTFTTNKWGTYTETRTPGLVGTYQFAVICGDCRTNDEVVNVVNPAGTTTTTTPADGGEDEGGDGGDLPLTYCESSWPLVYNQGSCDARVGCPTGEVCTFIPGGIVAVNRCECVKTNTCDGQCKIAGYSGGWCSGETDRDPCNGDHGLLSANQYCPSFPGLIHGACCCR